MAKPERLKTDQELAAEQGIPVEEFIANKKFLLEAYSTGLCHMINQSPIPKSKKPVLVREVKDAKKESE